MYNFCFSLLQCMGPFIIKQLHRQRIPLPSSHFFFHDRVSQKGQKHNYRMQQHTNKEIWTVGVQESTWWERGFCVKEVLPLLFLFHCRVGGALYIWKIKLICEADPSTFMNRDKRGCLNFRINSDVMFSRVTPLTMYRVLGDCCLSTEACVLFHVVQHLNVHSSTCMCSSVAASHNVGLELESAHMGTHLADQPVTGEPMKAKPNESTHIQNLPDSICPRLQLQPAPLSRQSKTTWLPIARVSFSHLNWSSI